MLPRNLTLTTQVAAGKLFRHVLHAVYIITYTVGLSIFVSLDLQVANGFESRSRVVQKS